MPYRRLCVDFGARVTMGEMAYARQVNRRSKSELALLRRSPHEACFGVQLAASSASDAVSAGRRGIDYGAEFVDLNCGCPIHDVVKRGMGATLLQRPAALGKIVEAMARELEVPVTVKIRSGWKADKPNFSEVARIIEESGAAALTLHPRSREQRYSKAADWSQVAQLVAERGIPIIGNGDILTHYEARRCREQSGCASVMVGRGALIKPWLFQEIETGVAFEPSAEERVAIYRRLAVYMKEHFREDARGRERTMRFLPWHMGFFWRYRPLPESEFAESSLEHPLMQTRNPVESGLPLLDQVLRDPREPVHLAMADALWDAESDAEAIAAFLEIGAEQPPEADADGVQIATSHG